MKRLKPATPFPVTGYFGPEYFCDREKAADTIIGNIKGGQSTTLVSIRRIGKTGLIKHIQHILSDKMICIYADILPTENSLEFLNTLATAILNAVPHKSRVGTRVWNFIKSLRPVITFDSLSGEPNVSFNIQTSESEHQIDALFAFLEKQESRVLFAIDEFQQILNYPETNTDAWLRKIIQQLKNVVFIFSGSQQHLINNLFTNPSKPFFRSTLLFQLDKIDHTAYFKFIQHKFFENKKEIDENSVSEILEWTNRHTYYTQILCNRIFINTKKKVEINAWKNEANKLLKEQEYVFFAYRDMLTKQQWALLKAMAKEKEVFAPTANNFLMKHSIGSPATVLRSLKSLQKKELIYSGFNPEGKKYYSVYDVFFQRWIQS